MPTKIEPVPNLTHSQLCDAAWWWGRGTARCKFGFREHESRGMWAHQYIECPDYIGFLRRNGNLYSVIVECKASRSDFLADQKKWFRKDKSGAAGSFKFYMVPRGLIHPNEVPDGWGLLYATPDRAIENRCTIRVMKNPPGWKHDLGPVRQCNGIEAQMLYDALNRMASVTVFDAMFKPKTKINAVHPDIDYPDDEVDDVAGQEEPHNG